MVLKFAFHITMMITLWPIHLQASAQDSTITKDGCDPTCGGVEIPYPFGIKYPKCYVDTWFEIECRNTSSGDERPYIKSIDMEVTAIDVSNSRAVIKNPIYSKNCGKEKGLAVKNLGEGAFVYSQDYNKFMAAGCNNIVVLHSEGSEVSGCASICEDNKDDVFDIFLESVECHGKYCCESTLPSYLSVFNATIEGLGKSNECGYALIVQDFHKGDAFLYNYSESELKHLNEVPAVLEWEIPYISISELILDTDINADCSTTNITSTQHTYSGMRCECFYGYHGNPYIVGGCKAVVSFAPSVMKGHPNWIIIGVSLSFGSISLFLGLWKLYKVGRKKMIKKRREKFFKQNGGLLLKQRLSSDEVTVDKVKLFKLKDIEKATDQFNMNRVIGKGGQGTVYKGMLIDGKIVAVKKLKVKGKVEEFINEFSILSQINHRNVVKLLGCCLETKIPLLVYEFIPNGNLFEYLHDQQNEPMTWDMRLRIATEVAGALFYLHSAASQPIYHRDIKSTNILLDEKYRAKVADFGTSRMVSVEATHLTTAVQGTFGYLDPEYFRTSQFTDKSDVYSFGVVLVELLTRQKPISYLGPEEARGLASYFTLCIEENRLFDIIDERVRKEGKKEHILTVVAVASRCLEVNGRKRPTMKEVTLELESVRKLEKMSSAQENQEEYEFGEIEYSQAWIASSPTSNTGSTLECKTSTSEVMPIFIE
ncbi:wall-associated receptor kinase-like 10 [Abrus precatorius]|uniref:Wall-associated receptor kinase-like 10 n=1 Tax=Abrus precatorius TaxID=3816 RepID=A0A8B8K583_ABRPR|nr:wall-associated receptor kinase-like 10 [Abrus precatorius]